MKVEELKKYIVEAGVVGAGGAGFPTHAKLNPKVEIVILNCAECEPLLKVDRQLLAEYSREIMDTLNAIVICLNARGIIAAKGSYESAIASVKDKIGSYDSLTLKVLPEVYPAGDEFVLIYETTGRIVPEGAIPIAVGAMVLNVETVLNIYNALSLSTPVTEKYITVTGEVCRPLTAKFPVGMSVGEAIRAAGGTRLTKHEVLIGGPMTGRIVTVDSPITKTTKAVIVLPEEHPIIMKKKVKPSIGLKRAMSTCSQCRMCTDLCPRNLLGHSIKPHRIMNVLAGGIAQNISDYTSSMLCSECGLCEMYSCHQGLSPRSLIKELKDGLRKNGVKNPNNNMPESADKLREGRMVPMERLISRLGLEKYKGEAGLTDLSLKPNIVKIPLLQHIGAPAVPVIKVGDSVKRGQLLAEIPEGKLGANIHASIDGFVMEINKDSISVAAGQSVRKVI